VPAADVNKTVLAVLHTLYSLAACCRALVRRPEKRTVEVEVKKNGQTETETKTITTVRVGSLEAAAPQAVRQLLRHVSSITVHTRIEGKGPRLRHHFEQGEITFASVGVAQGEGEPSPSGSQLDVRGRYTTEGIHNDG
jgi:hypothetical protein